MSGDNETVPSSERSDRGKSWFFLVMETAHKSLALDSPLAADKIQAEPLDKVREDPITRVDGPVQRVLRLVTAIVMCCCITCECVIMIAVTNVSGCT